MKRFVLVLLIIMPLLMGASFKAPTLHISSTPYQEQTVSGEIREGLLIHVDIPGRRTFTFLVIDNELFLNG